MFYRYEIKNNGNEEYLYLYLTMTYEFSKELGIKSSNNKIDIKAKNFIKNNSIEFNGNKVFLVVDGIIIKTIELKKDDIKKEIPTETSYSNNNFIINLKNENNIIINIKLKDYLLGVIATNSIFNLGINTLKSLCLLYRTYAFKMMSENNIIETNNEFQIYKPISYYKLMWLDNYQDIYKKIERAIDETDGEFITFNDEYILPFIHICNNGKTDTLKKYKYLEKINSLWDYACPYYLEIKDYDYKYLSTLLKQDIENLKNIEVKKLTESNYIKVLKIGTKIYKGEEFKNLLNLKSTDVVIIINPNYIRFITKGWGNNIGLSQFGANEIAKANCSYINIIKYYYPKVQIKKYI